MPMAGGRRQQRDQSRDHLLKGSPSQAGRFGQNGQGQAAGENRLTCPDVHKPVAVPSTAANSIGPAGEIPGY